MNKSATDKITKAKIQLLIKEPFFATLALSIKYEECSEIKTADIDGVTMRYNPNFIEKLSISKVKGLICHEVMHMAMLHHIRRGSRDFEKWNIACDYAINTLLVNGGHELPEVGLIDTAGIYKDLSSEQIYSRLPDPPKDKKDEKDKNKTSDPQKTKNPDPGGNGGVRDSQAKNETEQKQYEADAKEILMRAYTVAKQAGKLPGHFQELIDSIIEPVVDWRNVLNEFITEKTRNDYTYSQPSRRYLSQGLYMPSLQSIEKGKFILVIDTSSSIDMPLLKEFISEMQTILDECAESLMIYQVDTKVQKLDEYETGDDISFNVKGRGGTDFKPAFNHIEKEGYDCAALVYFTDGYCTSFPEDPGYPVLWATYNNEKFSPPFGEVVNVEKEE